MQLPELFRARQEDMPDAPEWFSEKFLGIYNQFAEVLYIGLNKNITYDENIDVQYHNIDTRTFLGVNEITPDDPYTFKSTIKRIPKGVTVMQCLKQNTGSHVVTTGPVSVDWEYQNGVITIYKIFNAVTDAALAEERFNVRLKVE